MSYIQLTKNGKDYIKYVCEKYNTKLLTGVKNGITWKANILKYNSNTEYITTGIELSNSLIYWFDKYSKDFELDANFIAAQAYVESKYYMWEFSTAAIGVTQFTPLTIYAVIINNLNKKPIQELSTRSMDLSDISLISNTIGTLENTYTKITSSDKTKLQQNVINNPAIMIKAQCYYMKYFADKSNSLASTALFCYNRGTFMANSYTEAIFKAKKYGDGRNKPNYIDEGVDYVLKIFGVLGDKNDYLTSNGILKRGYKEINMSFGYDENLKLTESFNSGDASVNDSSIFNNNSTSNSLNNEDIIKNEINKNKQYGYFYIDYPEQKYKQTIFDKKLIVLHHTYSSNRSSGDVITWKNKNENDVSTQFIISRNGDITQLFSTIFWSEQLNISELTFNKFNIVGDNLNDDLNKIAIGIEIDSWGGLIKHIDGKWYPPLNINDKTTPNLKVEALINIQEYPSGYCGYYAYEKYTNQQIETIKIIILAIVKKWTTISLLYDDNMWDVNKNALIGKSGIWSHSSFNETISDCHPQPELINMLKTLS